MNYKRCASSETRLRGAELNRPADVLFVLLSADNDSQVEAAAASSEKYPTITPTCCSHDSAYDLMIRHPAEQQELSVKRFFIYSLQETQTAIWFSLSFLKKIETQDKCVLQT